MNIQTTLDTAEPSNEAVFLQKLNRILTDDLEVTVQDLPDNGSDTNNIGGADAKRIYLNFKRIARDSKSDEEAITILKAVNLHELSHVEWTDISASDVLSRNHPELRTPEALKVAETAIKDAMNVLEDSRIENLRAAQYPNGGKYFLYQVMRYILKEYYKVRQAKADNKTLNELRARNAMRSAFILCYGRKFINPIIVDEIEQALIDGGHETKQNVETTKYLIDKYLIAKNLNERIIITIAFAKHVFGNQNSHSQQPQNGIGGMGSAPRYSPSPTNKTGKAKMRTEQSEKIEKEMREIVVEAIKTLNDPKSKKARNKTTSKKTNKNPLQNIDSMDAIDVLIKTAAGTIKTTTDRLAKDIKQTMEELRGKARINTTQGDDITPSPYTATANDKILSTRLLQLLRRVRNDLTSRYNTCKPAGRLDIRRVINTQQQSAKVFRKYQQSALGRSKMAVSLIIDASGSMQGERYNEAIGAAWSMEKALSTGNDYTQVLDYANSHRILKGFYHRAAKWDGTANGSTCPTTALQHALKTHNGIKHARNVRTHIVIALTDGDFTDGQESDPVITRMNKNGIVTVLVRIQNKNTPTHNFQIVRDIKEAKELEPVIEHIIRQVQNKLIRETRN